MIALLLACTGRADPFDRIAIGSCSEETEDLAILRAVAYAEPDLFLYVGDNVYGDAKAGDPDLPELRKAYVDLAANAPFADLRRAVPILATWDDHDYGLNDAGGDFPWKEQSERLFEDFWGEAAVGGGHPGVYGARTFGPRGRRVQVILLDTRFFRSPLLRGGDRYVADPDPAKTMLGEAQWAWLAGALAEPAELRLLVSSIQVLADTHPWESWNKLPAEQARLLALLRDTGAKGVILVSGDRHVAALYRREGVLAYPLHELTTSSLNRAFVKDDGEMATDQLGRVFTPANFGLVEVDWAGRTVLVTVRDASGAAVREVRVPFAE